MYASTQARQQDGPRYSDAHNIGGDRPKPPSHRKGNPMRTIPADQALRQRHLESALGHILQSAAYTESPDRP